MKRLGLSLTLLAILLVAGCASGGMMGFNSVAERLELRMTPDQVLQITGQPNGRRLEGDTEVWTWTNRLISGWSYDRADYHALFEDNQLIAYGAGTVRQTASGVLVIVPIGE